ncbi:MAG: DUF2283 domain-containing protein [bacterium]|nr:DUF2283 domain-containing protein [bacterium]MDZ4284461.1 DUF2283 domain-containing protein [Patescibacteria group bacterium]
MKQRKNKINPKIFYDKESNVLIIEVKKGRSFDSDVFGNLVLDYDKRGRAMRVNLYDVDFDRFSEQRSALQEFSVARRREVAVG